MQSLGMMLRMVARVRMLTITLMMIRIRRVLATMAMFVVRMNGDCGLAVDRLWLVREATMMKFNS